MPKHLEDAAVRADVGKRLRVARDEKGWSQARLAESLKLETITVSRIETGRRSLTAGCAIRAAEVLGVSITALLGVTESPATVEAEAIRLLRQMPERRQEVAIRMLREIAAM